MRTSPEELDKIAVEYHANVAVPDIHIENLCQEYFLRWLLPHIPASARVLELGYGDGLVTAALASHGCALTVLEGAKSLVESAQRRHPNIDCIYTLFEDYRPAGSYDVVLASHVLEHVDDPESMLRLQSTWLGPLGRLIIVVPNRNSLHRQLAVTMGLQPELDTLSKRDIMVGHKRVYSLPLLEADVVRAGLRVLETTGFFVKTLPNSMMLDYSRELLWALNLISSSVPKELLANIAVIASKDDA